MSSELENEVLDLRVQVRMLLDANRKLNRLLDGWIAEYGDMPGKEKREANRLHQLNTVRSNH